MAVLVFALHMQGLKIINPGYTDWLYVLNSDYSTHQLGWEYFRRLPWSFPIGKLENYAYPMVSSIGYTDSIPLLALFFKLFDSWLPSNFQYFGFWLFSCYLLQAFYGFKLGRRLSANQWIGVFSGLFMVIATPLLYRTPHPALCGQWLILASINAYFMQDYKRSLIHSGSVTLFSTFIHPYLFIMCLGIGLSTYLKWLIQQKIDRKAWLIWSISTLAGAYVLLYINGYFIIHSEEAMGLGLGEFSANLNTFINPLEFSQILPALRTAFSGQYEGFAYLGVGLFLLISIQLFNKKIGKHFIKISKQPITLVIIAMTLLAISPNVSFNDTSIINFSLEHPIFSTFRSNGRFIWPLYYSILLGALWAISKIRDQRFTLPLLILSLAVQVFDIWPLVNRKILHLQTYQSPLSASWELLFDQVETIYMYPPYLPSYASSGDALHFLKLGVKNKNQLSTGHLARRDDFIADSLFKQLTSQFRNESSFAQGEAIYIMDISKLPILINSLDQNLGVVRKLDTYLIFIPTGSLTPALNSLISQPPYEHLDSINILRLDEYMQLDTNSIQVLSIKDEASQSLCQETRSYFNRLGSELANLNFRESYLGIFKDGRIMYEERSQHKINYATVLPTDSILCAIDILSGGANEGNISSIKINGTEASLNQRGINIVTINKSGEVIQSACFDTYEQCAKIME